MGSKDCTRCAALHDNGILSRLRMARVEILCLKIVGNLLSLTNHPSCPRVS